ncbi:MAG TPA: glycosyltransferase N-terminal domain-containing protein [Candidatus Limnocylindrales bacterium]|nr:glycosyltransferase N-terminal domain-containing protein [Candidatus Limnocylindrales bacterium]
MISLGLAAYRGAATLAGAASPLLRGFGGRESAWRSAFTGGSADVAAAAGSVWIHAASMGEVVAARTWVTTLLAAGQRPPLLLTTRTTRGLARARRELGDQVVARVAPLDLPQLLRSFLKAAAPWRLDIIETEIWPHLIQESRRHNVAVVFVSASVTDRTSARLRRWGFSGPGLFGQGVWVLAQSERHAERFRSLGVPPARIAVTGDLKSEPPTGGASRDPAARRAVVFGSLRPGEEAVALALARNLNRDGARTLIVAPRHRDGLERVVAAFKAAGVPVSLRREEERQGEALPEWIAGLSAAGPPSVGILATQGELPLAYESAAAAIVGGTFAPYGGHNAMEPAARGCAVVVGPHATEIRDSVESLAREHAVLSLGEDAGAGYASAIAALLQSHEALRSMGQGAVRAAAAASQSARRSLEALERFGLTP